MKSQNDINKEIAITTIKIQKKFPELIKYLNEIPEQYSTKDHEGINTNDLEEYLDSLNDLLATYSKEY
ncbi:MAG: hypothetical protein OSB25_03740 [Salibacteraceae bacterium]|nr:hypothetical protein [Salibacteraceae bacterium]